MLHVVDQVLLRPLAGLKEAVIEAMPLVLNALAVIVIGYIAAVVMRRLTQHALRAIGLDVIYRRISHRDQLVTEGIAGLPSDVGGFAVYWTIMISAALYALQALGLKEAAFLLERLIGYLPMVFVSIGIVTIGLYAADLFSRVVTAAAASAHLPMPRWWGLAVQYATVGFTVLAVLDYLRIATSSVLLVVGVMLSVVPVAAIIAFGWGGRRQAEEMITGRALKRKIDVGDLITFPLNDRLREGEVAELGVTFARIRTAEGELIVPYTSLAREVLVHRRSPRESAPPEDTPPTRTLEP